MPRKIEDYELTPEQQESAAEEEMLIPMIDLIDMLLAAPYVPPGDIIRQRAERIFEAIGRPIPPSPFLRVFEP